MNNGNFELCDFNYDFLKSVFSPISFIVVQEHYLQLKAYVIVLPLKYCWKNVSKLWTSALII